MFVKDEEFGLFLWAAMTTGARRGELLALREDRFDFEVQTVRFSKNYLVKDGQHIEKNPKTGRGRIVSLDPLTCELVEGFLAERREAAGRAGVIVPRDAFVFSPDPAGAVPWNPDTMTHRYERYAGAVGIGEFAEGVAALLGDAAAVERGGSADGGRAARALGGVDDAELLRPVRSAC